MFVFVVPTLVEFVAFVALVAVAALPVHEPELPDTFPVTLPVKLAVMVPALKLPLASLNTIVLGVLTSVAFDAIV